MTYNTIKALQMYYLAAVNRHIGGSWKDLKLDIMSTYFHCTSTDAEHRHSLCSEKWCFYLQDKKANVQIRPHKNMEAAIRCGDKDVLKKIHEIYQDLTSQDLLERCLKGRTQNPNESLHSNLWGKCPKNKFCEFDKVLFSAQVTMIEHNFGYVEGSALSLLGIPVSKEAYKIEEKFE